MNPSARLLVVDDTAPQLEALCEMLREAGHLVVGCAAPSEALDRLRLNRYDILLCDLNMPQMDGIALTREALAIDPDLVPVLMTGQGTISTAVEAMKVGALDYVLKPFRLAAITPVLARALELRRLRLRNRELQEDVARRTALLEAANRELDAFAGRIAHDLRGPVLGMLGCARLLLEHSGDRLDAEGHGFVQRILDAGQRTEHMIRDLLAFARLGDSPLNREAVALGKVVRAARETVEHEGAGRAIDWQVNELPTIQGDASLLESVFANLLSNALKYTRPRERARIEVGVQPQDGQVLLWVRDNGVGFDPAYAGRLFTPFQRLHAATEFEGNGVGLANVKLIVERHGGSVSAESQPGRGAVFRIALPA